MSNLVEGALVRWTENSKIFGVISEITERSIKVKFDEQGPPSEFTRDNPPLERVLFNPGDRVNRYSTDEKCIVRKGGNTTPPEWLAYLLDKREERNIAEADLRPDISTNPLDRIRNKYNLGSAKDVNLALVTRDYRLQHFNNALVSLAAAKVDLKPYQVSVIHRVIHSYPHRFLLCDEVGLGKTIEAGMIFKELQMRGQAKRTLVIVPANLQLQWQFELKSKFNADFSILNRDTVSHLKNLGFENPFASPDYRNVIVSERWITRDPWRELVQNIDWELIIVDEAHHARSHSDGKTTQLFRLVNDLTDVARFSNRAVLMLTATPMQLHPHELFSLIEMLDPALFPSEASFEDHRSKLRNLNYCSEKLKTGVPTNDSDRENLVMEISRCLEISSQEVDANLNSGEDEIESLREQLSQRHLLSEVLIRNRKSVVGGFLGRQAYRWEVGLTAEEHDVLRSVEEYVQQGYALAERIQDAKRRNAINFVMVIFQKLMASSIYALRCSLARRHKKLEDKEVTSRENYEMEDASDSDYLPIDEIGIAEAVNKTEIEELSTLICKLEMIGELDSKAKVFLDKMDELRRGDQDAKVLVFTQSRDTQDYLEKHLLDHGWDVSLFHGQLNLEEKNHSVDLFRTATAPHILVSTEAGGEGRNFQFCHLLVNYDLPWNPMRVEQRIGRVDRIGQSHVVQIFNLWVKGTIEERILDILQQRINVFEETVGGLDSILGDSAEKSLRRILRLGLEKRDQQCREWENSLGREVEKARQAEEQLQDFIMDTKSFSQKIAERISKQSSPIGPEKQECFMKNLLVGMGAYIKRKPRGQWELHFHDPFRSDHENLFPTGPKCLAVLRPDMQPDSESIQYFAFGHPVVEAAIKEVLISEWKGNAGSRRLKAGGELQAASGWLFVWEAEIPDIREHKKMIPVFVRDGNSASLDLGRALIERAASFSEEHEEEDIDPETFPLDTLDRAYEDAEVAFKEWVSQTNAVSKQKLIEKIQKERHKLEKYFDYRDHVAEQKLSEAERRAEECRVSNDENERRILPILEDNLKKTKATAEELKIQRSESMKKLRRKEGQTVANELVSVCRIEILPE